MIDYQPPSFDDLKTSTLEMAMEAIGPEILEANAGFPERPLEPHETLSPLAVHENEVAALLLEVSERYSVSEELKRSLVISAILHDAGKRNPNDCVVWHSGVWDTSTLAFYRQKHQLEGQESVLVHASKAGAHPDLWIAAAVAGNHHEENLLKIEEPHLRWIIEKVQEADKAQAVYLDPRKYKRDRLKAEGLGRADPWEIRERLFKPSVCPDYFGIKAGVILDAAIARIPEAQTAAGR